MGERIGDSNGVPEVEDEEAVLPGFRFHPTDEELVGFYLRRKVQRRRLSLEIIKEVDIYKFDPWELPRAGILGEKEWYFFCLRGRKYRNSIRPNRVTGSGFWKATGIDRPIHSSRSSGEVIGLKKSLVYYQGSAGKGAKTDWMMHEYRLPSSPETAQEAEVWTICRIIKRNASTKKYKQQQQQPPPQQQQLSLKEANESLDSCSKSSNGFESDCGEEIRNLGSGSFGNYMEADQIVQLSDSGFWNAEEQAYSSAWRPEASNAGEIFSEGSWDEIGRMVDYMMEAATSYDLVYY